MEINDCNQFFRVRYERSHIFSRSKVIVKTMQSHRVSDIEYDAELSSSFAFPQLQPPQCLNVFMCVFVVCLRVCIWTG